MKTKKFSPRKRLVIITSSILILIGFLSISPFYFSYLEVKNLANECYDHGGHPKIKKSGIKVEYFSCDL